MAKLKKDAEAVVTIRESDYMTLLEDHLTLKALKISGIEEMPLYKGITSIIEDGHVEIHMKPIKRWYR